MYMKLGERIEKGNFKNGSWHYYNRQRYAVRGEKIYIERERERGVIKGFCKKKIQKDT